MVTTVNEVRELQRATWNKFSPGWKKHDGLVVDNWAPMGEALLEATGVRPGFSVLDAATGTGEPGLTAARRVGNGHVIGSDIAGDMLKIAAAKARELGIANYETKQCDESTLPFPDSSFDAVICRLGVMYFPDIQTALREMARVVKPGRAVALSTWSEPQKNPWAAIASRIVNEALSIQPPPPGAPGLFRCAIPGALRGHLAAAGLRNVSETEVSGTMRFASAQTYWDFTLDVVAPIATALSRVDEQMKDRIGRSVIDAVRARYGNGPLRMEWSTWVAGGTK